MNSSGRISVIIVESMPKVVKQLKKVLNLVENIEIVAELQSGQDAVTFIRDSKPEIALIDTNLSDINGLDLTELIRREYPFTQVIIVSQDKFYDTVLKSMRIGAADFITHDVKLDEFNVAIKRAYDLAQERYVKGTPSYVAETIPVQPTVPSTPTKLGSIITVYSPKGGSGTTTVAINLALALQSADATVAIADSSMQYGDVAILLNEVGKFSMHDLVPSIHELDTGLIDDVLLLHKSTGLKLLAAPPTPELAEHVNGNHISKVLEMMKQMFSYVIVNTGSYITDSCLAAIDASNLVVLVVTQEVTAIQGIHRFLELWDKLGLAYDRLLLVVNKYDKKYSINTKRIQENVKIPIVATIERDDEAALQAANLGIPLAIFKKSSPVITNIANLSDIIVKKLDEVDTEDRIRLFSPL